MAIETVPRGQGEKTSNMGRALLARVADSSYWMGRYIERAEQIARMLLVSTDILTGTSGVDDKFARQVAADVLHLTQCEYMLNELAAEGTSPEKTVMAITRYMAMDRQNPGSLINCLTKARENARGIREQISNEMWEHINTLYWMMQSPETAVRIEEAPQEILRQIMTGSLLFQGLTDQTMEHGQAWLFMGLARHLERVDITCRVLADKCVTLARVDTALEESLRVIHWMAVLRTCCCLEAYRRANLGEVEPKRVPAFIIFEAAIPRSIHFCVRAALEAVEQIRTMILADTGREAQRILGRLYAELQYSQALPHPQDDLLNFIEELRAGAALAAMAVQEQWLMHPGNPPTESPTKSNGKHVLVMR